MTIRRPVPGTALPCGVVARSEVDEAQRELGRRLRAEREQQEVRLEDVADVAGVSWGFLADVERGRRAASLATLVKITQALGTSVVEVLDGIPAYGRRRGSS